MNYPPQIETKSPLRIVNVGGASATLQRHIDAPLIIAQTQMRHPVIVVEELSFSHLIEMDILGFNDVQLGVGASSSIRLDVEQ